MHKTKIDPIWDEGISLFLLGEYERLKAPLTIDDLQGFANQQAVRIGDFLETLYLMTIYGDWQYADHEGIKQELNEEALDELYAKGRLDKADLADFDGVWSPAK